MEIISFILLGLAILLGLGSFVCWIMVVIKAFQSEASPLLGILCIIPCGGLGALVIGWIKNAEWGITQIMMIWTGIIVGQIVCQIAAFALLAASGAAM